MKHLVLIIHDDLKLDTIDLLHTIEGIKGFTLSSVEGHGLHFQDLFSLSNKDKVVGYTSQTRVDILLNDKDLDSALTALRKSSIGLNKHGMFWITDVEKYDQL